MTKEKIYQLNKIINNHNLDIKEITIKDFYNEPTMEPFPLWIYTKSHNEIIAVVDSYIALRSFVDGLVFGLNITLKDRHKNG